MRGVKIVEDDRSRRRPQRGRADRAARHGPARSPRRRRGRDRLRGRRQLRRPVGAPVRRARRRQRAALVGRALLHRHRPHRRRPSDAAGAARSRRLHLLQGRGRRPADGRLRAEGQAVDRRPDPRDLPVRAARRGLGPVRAADDGGDPPHAVPRDGQGQDAPQRARELHARRQLHPRRGARAAPLLRRRRLQLGRHRQLGRRRQADRRMDRRRRAAERPRRRRHPPLRRAHGEQEGARRAHRRDARPALRDALAAPGARDGAAAANEPALRPARRQGRGLRREERLGAGELLPRRERGRRRRPYPHTLGKPAWLGDMVREQRATRQAVALYDQTSFGKMLLQGRDALAVLQRLCANEMDVAPGPHGLHADAQRARRLRERRHRHAPRRRPVPDRHRLGADAARPRLDLAPHARRRSRRRWSTSAP